MKKNIIFIILALVSCKPQNNLGKNSDCDFRYSSSLFSDQKNFEKVTYDSKTGIYKVKEIENSSANLL